MSSKTEIIDLTSSSSSSSSDGWNAYFPPIKRPSTHPLNTNQRDIRKHEMGEPSQTPIPADSDSADDSDSWIGYPPSDREQVSPFLFTSEDESSEDEYEDPSYLPPSTPERPQPRSRKSNLSLPRSREVVLGLPSQRGKEDGKGN